MQPCDYVFKRGAYLGATCGELTCMHKFNKYPIVYMQYTFPSFIRFFNGVKTFDKKYTNLYNNSCNNEYMYKYHHIMPRWVALYNSMKVYYGGVFDDIFINVKTFVIHDYLTASSIF